MVIQKIHCINFLKVKMILHGFNIEGIFIHLFCKFFFSRAILSTFHSHYMNFRTGWVVHQFMYLTAQMLALWQNLSKPLHNEQSWKKKRYVLVILSCPMKVFFCMLSVDKSIINLIYLCRYANSPFYNQNYAQHCLFLGIFLLYSSFQSMFVKHFCDF